MSEAVYKRLAKHLDNLPGGYPATTSGVELKILRKLFTPEEAAMAVHATLIPEGAKVLARRAKMPLAKAEELLNRMARGGLLLSFEKEGRPPKYMAAQYVVGIWEYHVNTLDRELVDLMNEYVPSLMHEGAWKKAPQLRTVPVGKSVEVRHSAMGYEQAEELVRAQKKIVVAPCICRKEHEILGHGCGKLSEACLIFGMASDYYLKNGIGRMITQEEALEILARADKEGLVVQPSNAKKAINICLCCGCCCQILKGLKRIDDPAGHIGSAFIASIDAEKCIGCKKCVKRCQMDAISMADEKAVLNKENCIGCGLCVTTCPGEAITLERRAGQPQVPDQFSETMLSHARARGKLKATDLAWMSLKSKLDRLLA